MHNNLDLNSIKFGQNSFFTSYTKKSSSQILVKQSITNLGIDLSDAMLLYSKLPKVSILTDKLNDVVTRIQRRLNDKSLDPASLDKYRNELAQVFLAKPTASFSDLPSTIQDLVNGYLQCAMVAAKHDTNKQTVMNYFPFGGFTTNETDCISHLKSREKFDTDVELDICSISEREELHTNIDKVLGGLQSLFPPLTKSGVWLIDLFKPRREEIKLAKPIDLELNEEEEKSGQTKFGKPNIKEQVTGKEKFIKNYVENIQYEFNEKDSHNPKMWNKFKLDSFIYFQLLNSKVDVVSNLKGRINFITNPNSAKHNNNLVVFVTALVNFIQKEKIGEIDAFKYICPEEIEHIVAPGNTQLRHLIHCNQITIYFKQDIDNQDQIKILRRLDKYLQHCIESSIGSPTIPNLKNGLKDSIYDQDQRLLDCVYVSYRDELVSQDGQLNFSIVPLSMRNRLAQVLHLTYPKYMRQNIEDLKVVSEPAQIKQVFYDIIKSVNSHEISAPKIKHIGQLIQIAVAGI